MNRSISSVGNANVFLNYVLEQKALVLAARRPFAAPAAWIFDPLGPATSRFYRIHSEAQPDHFLHVQTEALSCEPIHFGANSSYWFLESVEAHDTFILRNFWRQNYYIYRDGETITAGPLADPEKLTAAHWLIEEMSQERFLVPIHLDALWLPHEQAVVAATADFTRLPHFNRERDINSDTAHISESISNPPLDPPQLYLKAGLHLHWALPDALHRGVQASTELHLPHVPDRWLVTKRSGEAIQSWVVESNYLYPADDTAGRGSISYPFTDGVTPHPFRHMGRKVPLSEWTERDADGANPDYLHPLTALGYGEPNFAAFYPNCYSVFGFYDEMSEGQSLDALKNATFEVFGWHSSNDILRDKSLGAAIDDLLKNRPDVDPLSIAPFKFAALQNEFGWTIEDSESKSFPIGTLYFARLTISSDAKGESQVSANQPKIVIGNTPTEALSSHLGWEIGGLNNRAVLEEQLEALMLISEVEGEPLDSTAKFREVRHGQGFKGVHGGVITTIVPISEENGQADAYNSPHPGAASLPIFFAQEIDKLNLLERKLFQERAVLRDMQTQLFADWYKYMLATYPPADAHDDFPDSDEIAFFIEQHGLQTAVAYREQLEADPLHEMVGLSLRQQRANVQEALQMAVTFIQMLYPTDINDWPNFLGLLAGRIPPRNPIFQPVLSWLREALPASQQALLDASPISEQGKQDLINNLNALLDALPPSLLTAGVLAALPAEAARLASQLASLDALDRLRLGRLLLEGTLPETLARRGRYRLQQIPDPHFWEPADPVVLIADADLQLTNRHGEDGRLRDDGLLGCYTVQLPSPIAGETLPLQQIFNAIMAAIDEVAASLTAQHEGSEGHIGFYTWRHQPWHPFMLEWSAEFFQIKDKGNHAEPERGYAPDYITSHYEYPEDSVDLHLNQAGKPLIRSGSVYTGRTIMLDFAQPLLIKRLEEYCAKYLAPRYYDANHIPAAERPNKPPLSEITAWAAANRGQLSQFDQAVADIQAHLTQNTTPPIAQALSGFHAALLQHKQTLQLPIADPLGFPAGKALAEAVKQAVDNANLRAPKPEDAFNPIRAGALRLLHLRLVDTFGQIQPIFEGKPDQSIQGSEPLTQLDPHTLLLPPRLSQPARINAFWLSAHGGQAHDAAEMVSNAHPATSPICGWFVPNYYDNSLLVYNQAGQPLGALISSGEGVVWSSAPGRQHRILEADILNEHLYRLVSIFLSQDSNYLDDTLTGIESALENIIPASQHTSLSLLIGRPLAVVRASIKLALLGQPAVNQNWNRFRETINTHKRDSDRFSEVAFPLRIGEHARLNDGLLGFWREFRSEDGGTTTLDKTLYLPQTPDTMRTGSINHPHIIMHRPGVTPHLSLALDTPEQILTMLLDPRAVVHISSGVLPVKTMTIPSELYLPTLQNLEMTFYSGPFVTKRDGIELPLPTEPGYTWSLLTKENGAWDDTHEISPVEQNATFSQSHVIREGWLKLKKDEEV